MVGQRLVEHEQGGEERAAYGTKVLKLSRDLQTLSADSGQERKHRSGHYCGPARPDALLNQ
jgi:hypothetical protein